MAKQEKPTPVITVDISQKAPIKAIVTPFNNFQPVPGEYHMVKLDKSGNEIPGSDFSIGERTYNRTYKHRTDFKVKKNPTK